MISGRQVGERPVTTIGNHPQVRRVSFRQHEPGLHGAFEKFYATADFEQQVCLAQKIEEEVLAPIGGLWKKDELLTFGNQASGQQMFLRLFRVPVVSQAHVPTDADQRSNEPSR